MAETERELLGIIEDQHGFINELIELLALGHKMDPEALAEARGRQARIKKALARTRRNLETAGQDPGPCQAFPWLPETDRPVTLGDERRPTVPAWCDGWQEMAHAARVEVVVCLFSTAPGDAPEPLNLCPTCYAEFRRDNPPGTYMTSLPGEGWAGFDRASASALAGLHRGQRARVKDPASDGIGDRAAIRGQVVTLGDYLGDELWKCFDARRRVWLLMADELDPIAPGAPASAEVVGDEAK